MNIRPQDLPEIRAELATTLSAPEMAWFYEDRAAALARRGGPYGTPEEFQLMEVKGLLLDELFYVAEEMFDLAKAAAKTLPPFTLLREDVPSELGFAYIAPGTHAPPGALSSIAVVEWWLTDDGVRLNFYCDTELMLASMTQAGKVTPAAAEHHRRLVGCLSPMLSEAWIPFGRFPIDDVDAGDEEFLRIIRAVWLLMQQPLAKVSEVTPDRSAQKRLRRMGRQPAAVRVIELRRPQRAGTPTENSDREYHHQWIVRGHWRQHWHPKRQVHRPVWIAPHIKGPEGAPLIGGEKVYALKR